LANKKAKVIFYETCALNVQNVYRWLTHNACSRLRWLFTAFVNGLLL